MDGHQPSRPHQTVPQHVTLPAGLTKAKIQEFPGPPYHVLGSTKAFMFPTKSSLMFCWSENYTLRNRSRELSSSWSFCLFMPHTCPTAPAGESYYLCYVAFHIGHICTLFHSCCPLSGILRSMKFASMFPPLYPANFYSSFKRTFTQNLHQIPEGPTPKLGGGVTPLCHLCAQLSYNRHYNNMFIYLSRLCGYYRSSFDLHIQVPNP